MMFDFCHDTSFIELAMTESKLFSIKDDHTFQPVQQTWLLGLMLFVRGVSVYQTFPINLYMVYQVLL